MLLLGADRTLFAVGLVTAEHGLVDGGTSDEKLPLAEFTLLLRKFARRAVADITSGAPVTRLCDG
jgi:hypothetical protein